MKYRPLLLSPLGLIPGALPAGAADLPVKAPPVVSPYMPSWAGWYVGVNVGVISDRSEQSAFQPAGFGNYCWSFDCNFRNKQTATGVLGGVQIGYNFQAGNWVLGAEADIAGSSAKKTTSGTRFGLTWVGETGPKAISTARLRLGYAFGSALVYATGGAAFVDLRDRFLPNTASGYTWSQRAGWQTGFTVGGGIEYAFARNWSIKGEGLYYDVGKQNHLGGFFASNFGLQDKTTGVIGRIGLNYAFH